MKKQLLLILAALLPMMASADDSGTCGTNVTWTYVEATHTLTISGEGSMADYSSNTMPWYPYRKEMTKVIIENGVTSIGDYAFGYCNDLTSITIPNSVSSIGSFAFKNCSGLTSITIPNSVTSIGNYAFSNCSGLTSITIPNSVTSIGNSTFSNCSGLTSITIPNSVTSIGESAFGYCSGLTSITIPNSVTSIGSSAFAWCSGLTSIIIPNSVTNIGQDAFDSCSGLTSVTIPNSVTTIGYGAFGFCRGLTSIYISDLARWCNINISNSGLSDRTHHLYLGDHEVTDLLIPDGVTTINSCSFKNCAYLTSITIPNSVTTIGEQAFSGCNRVKTLKLPDNLRLIRPSTFSGCSGLESVTIPPTVEVIYQNAFNGCYSLESVTSQATNPPFLYDNSFSDYSIPLNVPSGCKSAYEDAQGWRNFTNISDGNMYNQLNITMENDMQTYCPLDDVDFSNVEGLKAFTATGYDHGTLTVSRVLNAPAGTGLLLQGTAGVTYQVPYATQTGYYINLLHGLTQDTQVSPTTGDQTNFLLGKKNGVTTFYRVAQTGTVSAGKAYLQLPTSVVGDLTGSRVMRIVADDETTGISEALPLNDNGEMTNDNVYDLQGRRVTKPTRGLYIVNGRKVVIK